MELDVLDSRETRGKGGLEEEEPKHAEDSEMYTGMIPRRDSSVSQMLDY